MGHFTPLALVCPHPANLAFLWSPSHYGAYFGAICSECQKVGLCEGARARDSVHPSLQQQLRNTNVTEASVPVFRRLWEIEFVPLLLLPSSFFPPHPPHPPVLPPLPFLLFCSLKGERHRVSRGKWPDQGLFAFILQTESIHSLPKSQGRRLRLLGRICLFWLLRLWSRSVTDNYSFFNYYFKFYFIYFGLCQVKITDFSSSTRD